MLAPNCTGSPRSGKVVRLSIQEIRDRSWAYSARHRAEYHGSKRIDLVLRSDVFRKSGGVCHVCSLPVNPSHFHVDHVTPLARGGNHTLDNLAVTHPACNQHKGCKVEGERVVLVPPRHSGARAARTISLTDDEWAALQSVAEHEGLSASALVREMIREWRVTPPPEYRVF